MTGLLQPWMILQQWLLLCKSHSYLSNVGKLFPVLVLKALFLRHAMAGAPWQVHLCAILPASRSYVAISCGLADKKVACRYTRWMHLCHTELKTMTDCNQAAPETSSSQAMYGAGMVDSNDARCRQPGLILPGLRTCLLYSSSQQQAAWAVFAGFQYLRRMLCRKQSRQPPAGCTLCSRPPALVLGLCRNQIDADACITKIPDPRLLVQR